LAGTTYHGAVFVLHFVLAKKKIHISLEYQNKVIVTIKKYEQISERNKHD